MGCNQSVTNTTVSANGSKTRNIENLSIVPANPAQPASESISYKVAFAAGCYWGTEKFIVKDFQKKFPGAIKKARVGFMSPLQSPKIKNPNYQQVCSGQSGHIEVLYVELNNPSLHFEELCRFFFSFHDPTLKGRQGNDIGFQYSSWIFCGDDEQFQIAKKVKEELQLAIDKRTVKQFFNKTVQTQISGLKPFTEAHAAHQEYLSKHPNGYCNHRIRLKKWFEIKETKE